jgi:outer membrane protein assembly factor BamB
MRGSTIQFCTFLALTAATCVSQPSGGRAEDASSAGPTFAHATAEQNAWPCWSGPRTTFVAPSSGNELVADLNKARLIWQSQEITPMGKAHAARSGQYSAGRHGGDQQGKPSGGGGSVVVSDGRVFLSYYLPSGDAVVPDIPGGRSFDENSRRVAADDVVLCIDAANGKTLWKRVFKDQGVNIQDGKGVWTINNAGPNGVNVTVDGDVLVARAGQVESPREGRKPRILGLLGAWRITPEKVVPLWKHADVRYAVHGFHVPIPANGHLYVPCFRGPLLCIETITGDVVAEADVPVGKLPGTNIWTDGRLISETDGSHMSMNVHMIQADASDLRELGQTWLNPHPPTTSYVPAMCHAYVDGRLYVRGADGVYCYDLRVPEP